MIQNFLVRSLITLFTCLKTLCVWFLLLIPNERARVLTRFIFGTPFYILTISIDRWLFPTGKRLNPFIPFPRDTFEVVSRGEELFQLVREYQQMRKKKGSVSRNYAQVGYKKTEEQQQQQHNVDDNDSITPLLGPVDIPDDAEFVSLVRSGETDQFIKETLKKVQVGFFTLKFRVKNGSTSKICTLDLFIKTPSQRSLGRIIQGMGSAMNERQNEQRFYEDVFPRTDPEETNIAYVYASFYSRLFQHTCIVAEKVNTQVWKSTTDAEGMSVDQAEALVKASARFHAQFWAPPRDAKNDKMGLHAYPERSGLAWLDGGMSLFFTDDDKKVCPDWMPSLWPTLCSFYDKSMMAGSHGDCRPGNMLFSGRFNNVRGRKGRAAVEVLMTDWEACNICPISYDFCYSLLCGFPSYQRRGEMRRLWNIHIESLLAALEKHKGKREAAAIAAQLNGPLPADGGFHELKLDNTKYKMETMMDRLELEVDIFPIVVAYFGWLLTRTGGVGDTQGNLEGDCNAWGDRLRTAILDTLLCDGGRGDSTTQNDGYETWTDGKFVSGKTECHCKEKTTMEELGHIFSKKGNLFPIPDEGVPASHETRCRIAEDGTVMGSMDRPYHKMYLNERIVHFLEPYHQEGRRVHDTMRKGADKKNPAKFNRTVRQDLMDLAANISLMGMEERVKKAGY